MLWKCWRDLRVMFFVGLGWLALLVTITLLHTAVISASSRVTEPAASVIHGSSSPVQSSRSTGALRTAPRSAPPPAPVLTSMVVGIFLLIQAIAYGFLAWAMGSLGVGHDIAEGCGSFLLTRPVPRAHFIWSDWISGLASLGMLLLISVATLWFAVQLRMIRFVFVDVSSRDQRVWSMHSVPIAPTAIATISTFLFLGLVFGITHLGAAAFHKSTSGLLLCAGCVLGWVTVAAILRHENPWLASSIPSLLLRPFNIVGGGIEYVPHLTLSLLGRTALLPLFPLAAQFGLRRAEVD
jgi:hypothetical protein